APNHRILAIPSPRGIALRRLPDVPPGAARSGHGRDVPDEIGRAGSDAETEYVHPGRVPRVRMGRIRPGIEAVDHIAAGQTCTAGNPLPGRRVALRPLLRSDDGPGQVGARPRAVCAGRRTLL